MYFADYLIKFNECSIPFRNRKRLQDFEINPGCHHRRSRNSLWRLLGRPLDPKKRILRMIVIMISNSRAITFLRVHTCLFHVGLWHGAGVGAHAPI